MTRPDRAARRGAGGGSQIDAAREYALRLLERPRTEYQVRMALARRGFDGAVQDEVVGRLRGLGLLDDVAYARAYIEETLVRRPMGRRALAVALARRGVSREHVRLALAQVEESMRMDVGADAGPAGREGEPDAGAAGPEGEPGDLEEVAARRAGQAWLRRNRHRPDACRLQGYLMRRGFGRELAVRTVRELLGEESDDAFPGGG
ncbi:MAG: regulatory protein RecX [Bacillota bacterium]|nr:regulatory protein RecX [Bacillota bacterium]